MDRKFIQIRDTSIEDRIPLDPYDKGEVTRKQLYTYLFSDFMRGSLIVGFLFIDALVLTQIWFVIPHFVKAEQLTELFFGGVNIVVIYYIIGQLFIEFLAIMYQARIYRKVWTKIKTTALMN